ncbi:MAG: T9SS type A sorting domain-containing protein [Ignavibacteria bacterium]|nr:T9SS type A sorting domain-containing protein [Ignavibacteria bacterium]
MSKANFLILILFIFFYSNQLKAVDTSAIKYFPLSVGNYYSYLVTDRSGSNVNYYMSRGEITKDTMIGNKKYFFLSNFPYHYYNKWVRLDSSTGSLYQYDTSNSCPFYQYEWLLDSFAVRLNDTLGNCSIPFTCADTSDVTIFNNYQTKNKTFRYFILGGQSGPLSARSFAKDFGLTSYGEGYTFGSVLYQLKGCRINGVIYGDTNSVIGITNLGLEIPASFKLYQNYPNPFNPETKIRFDVSKFSKVSLTVYDILGNEIETLVNENLAEGSYEAGWNGSGLPSGLYFYRMSINGEITVTRKMMLVK